MTVGATKTIFTPAELADLLGGIQLNNPLQGHQVTVAVATLDARIIDKPSLLRNLEIGVGVTGTGGTTSVDVKVIPAGGGAAATVLNSTLDAGNALADGVRLATADFIDEDAQKVEPGDTVLVQVTAAATGGALALNYTLNVDQRADPQDEKPLIIGGKTP